MVDCRASFERFSAAGYLHHKRTLGKTDRGDVALEAVEVPDGVFSCGHGGKFYCALAVVVEHHTILNAGIIRLDRRGVFSGSEIFGGEKFHSFADDESETLFCSVVIDDDFGKAGISGFGSDGEFSF